MNPLLDFLRDPTVIQSWRPSQWNSFQPLARRALLLGRSYHLLERHGLLDDAPNRLVDQFQGALAQTRYVQGQGLREYRQVTSVLDAEGIPVVALKGVAYLVAGLPPQDWRNLSDIDLLVREADIERTEQALKAAGWVPSGEFDDYDQHYYRDWMHEVPPLIHLDRDTEVDMHHNLAPPVSRIKIDAAKLWERAVDTAERHGVSAKVLSPEDMLLHNAVHLFMNDELRGGLRDIVDFRDLFAHFSAQEDDFESRLLARADELGCGRALYYAVRSADRLVGLDRSDTLRAGAHRWAPPPLIKQLMDWLITQALAPPRLGRWQTAVADQLLFIRSHWVRMPPLMLLRHLAHKALHSAKSKPVDPDLPG